MNCLLMCASLCCAAQTLGDSRAAEYMKGRKTLEINPEHPIVKALKDKVDGDAAGAKVRVHSLAVAPNQLTCGQELAGALLWCGAHAAKR